MKLPRRRFLRLAAGAGGMLALSRVAKALAYLTRPVRIIVANAPAGGADIIARLIGQWLSERLGQPFIIENRPGGGGNIGTEAVVRALRTATRCSSSPRIMRSAYRFTTTSISIFIRDIAPVAGIMRAPNVMEVNPGVPAKTVPEFIAYARANPGRINFASSGIGTSIHLSGELFKMVSGINMLHVSYRGAAQAVTDLLGGQVQVMFDSLPASIEHIRAGKLRALAVTTAKRSDSLPDIPTVGEFVPGYEASQWYGLGAPKNTPAEIVDKLNKEINAALADDKLRFSHSQGHKR